MTDDPLPPFAAPQAHPDVDDTPALQALRARIHQDLDATQGAFHRAPLWRRLALLAGAAVAAVAPWLVVRWSLEPLPGLLLGAAGALAFIALALAPKRPSLGSRAGVAAAVAAVTAVALEVGRGDMGAALHSPFGKCLAIGLAFLAVPALLSSLWLRQTRLPLRRGHVLALAAAGLVGCAAVWMSCPVEDAKHLLLEHGGAAALGVVVVAGVAQALLRRPRPLATI